MDEAALGAKVREAREARQIGSSQLAADMKARGWNWSESTVIAVEEGERTLRPHESVDLAELIGFAVPRRRDPGRAFASNMRAVRDVRGWSARELGERSGLTRSVVANIENGRRSPDLEQIVAVCSALQVPASALDPRLGGIDA